MRKPFGVLQFTEPAVHTGRRVTARFHQLNKTLLHNFTPVNDMITCKIVAKSDGSHIFRLLKWLMFPHTFHGVYGFFPVAITGFRLKTSSCHPGLLGLLGRTQIDDVTQLWPINHSLEKELILLTSLLIGSCQRLTASHDHLGNGYK